jgi:5-oxoprolinase (ATP-hydrolysing) subunit A
MFNTPAEEALRLVETSRVLSGIESGACRRHYADVDTACVHGDAPGAVDIARGVRQALKDSGIEVAPFKVSQN